MLIPKPILTALSGSLNKLLSSNPAHLEHISKIAGKTIALEIDTLQTTVYLQGTVSGVRLTQHISKQEEALLTGPLSSWLNALAALTQKNKYHSAHPLPAGLKLTGDIALIQSVYTLLQNLSIDWEAYLAQYLGDTPSYWTHRGLKKIHHWGLHVKNSLEQNLKDYIHEETKQLPHKVLLEQFYKDINSTRQRVDRLSARVALLQK